MSIDVNVQNDLVIVTESSEDITVNVSNAAGPAGVGVPVGGTTGQVLKKLSNTNYDTYWALDGGGVPYSGATGQVDLGNYDLKVQGLTIGKGNNALVNNTALGHSTLLTITTGNFNTAVGYEALRNTTTGQYNTAVGQSSLFSNTTGSQNTAIGLNALVYNTTGGSNVVVGLDALQHNTTGSSNTAIGYNAGTHITGGSVTNTTASNSVFIGRDSKAGADGQTNQIVIGQNAVGNGSNTATFGNTATTANYFTGSINGGSFVKSGGTSSQFLKADGSVDSTTYVGGSGATGQVAYWNGTNSQTGSNNLFWDNANSRLGIGIATPTNDLSISKTVDGVVRMNITNLSTGANAFSGLAVFNSAGVAAFQLTGTGNSLVTPNQARLTSSSNVTNGITILTQTTAPLTLGTNDQVGITIFGSTRNVVLQNGGTFSDGGQRLQVQGDAFIKGSGATFGTIALQIQNSASTNLFRVYNNGYARFGNTNSTVLLGPQQTGTIGIDPNGTNFGFYSYTTTQVANEGRYWFGGEQMSQTSGANYNIFSIGNFVPTSGTGTFANLILSSSINQTGGANGITRGLLVSPTLTAAADWRSIEWSNNSGWGLYGAGTAPNFLGGNLTVSRNHNGGTNLSISNTTSGTAAGTGVGFTTDNTNYSSISKNSTTNTAYKIVGASDFSLFNAGNATNGDISILNDRSGGIIKFASGGSSTAQMTLTAAGRLLLGTTTESTFLLDVNGTARVSGASTFGGTMTISSGISITYTDNILIASSAAFPRITLGGSSTQPGAISIGKNSSATNNQSMAIGGGASCSGAYAVAIGYAANSTGIGSITFGYEAVGLANSFVAGSGYSADSQITNVYFGSGARHQTGSGIDYTINGSGASTGFNFNGGNLAIAGGRNTGSGTAGDVIISTSSTSTSSNVLQSLIERLRVKGTQGSVRFIPIATPSVAEAGDVYYDSSTNKLRCYNGTSWNDLF